MTKKKQFFVFLISFTITFGVGFLIWDVFINPTENILNQVLGQVNKISSKLFLASFNPDSNTRNDITKSDYEQIKATSDELLSDENLTDMGDFPDGSDVILAEEARQDLLDDIAEKLDVIQRQVDDLMGKKDVLEDEVKKDEDLEKDQKDEEKNDKIEKNSPIYSRILISEAKAYPIEQRSVKFYNPNAFAVDLTGWYLQRKTQNSDSWSSLVSSVKFQNKTIMPAGYFIISRSDVLADIFVDDLTITENNSLALKSPDGEISDIAYTPPEIITSAGGGGGGGSAPNAYPKVLISEVQFAGQTDEKQEFVELYNPSNTDVNLTDWYLQRKTSGGSSWSTYVSNNLFSGKTIPANGYFLIARSGYYAELADISTDNAITDNNSFALKNPNGDISDKLGFGAALDFELLATVSPSLGQSIGRKFSEGGTEQDTDNNLADFEIQTPTPKTQNETYAEPPPVPPDEKDIPTGGSIIINDNALYTNNRNVNLAILPPDNFSGVIEMRIANGSHYYDWESYVALKSWELPATNGLKTVRVKFRDDAGHETIAGISDTITLDTLPPIITLIGEPTLNLNMGDAYNELGATVSDSLDPFVLVSIGGDLVSTTSPSTFYITYDAVDSALNYAIQVIRTVVVSLIQ